MNLKVCFSFILLLHSIAIHAQPACGNNPSASDFCSDATPICNLNGYCGNTSSSYTNYVSSNNHTSETGTPLGNVFCATIQNNSWIKFIASSTSAVFSVWANNCSQNNGIQMQIYATADCYNFTAVSNCWNPHAPTNGQITANGLIPGQVYYFMIDGTEGDNCDYVIAANSGVSTPPTISANQIICKGDNAAVAAIGGVFYTWSSSPADPSLSGQTALSSITVTPSVTTTYTVTVTAQGNNSFCPNSNNVLSTVVTVNPLPLLTTVSEYEHCSNSDGTVTVNATGNSSVSSYIWNTVPAQTTQLATGLAASTYTVTVTDADGCSATATSAVSNVPYLTPVISGAAYLCYGTSANLDAGGGYTSYTWSGGSASQIISINTEGTYVVTVSDAFGCTGTGSIVVQTVSNPTPSISGPSFICAGTTALLDAGSGYALYKWSNGNITQNITINTGGSYQVTVTDTNGCRGNTGISVNQNNGPQLTASSQNEICGHQNGMASVTATGGLGTYTYLWNTGDTSASITGLNKGYYAVSVSDEECTTVKTIFVDETPGPEAGFSARPDFLTFVDEPVSTLFSGVSSGIINSWQWNFGDGSPSTTGNCDIEHFFIKPGNFLIELVVVDINGCSDTVFREFLVKDVFTFYIPNAFTPNGDGLNDGFSPSGNYVDLNNFEMYIYNRWGGLVFYTNKWSGTSSEGWNGTKNNSGSDTDIVPDVFAYKISVKELNGITHEYYGKIVVLK